MMIQDILSHTLSLVILMAGGALSCRTMPGQTSDLSDSQMTLSIYNPDTYDAAQLDKALESPVKDYEDMLQYQCAKAADCDIIVTNNKRDFYEFCAIPFMTSEEFLLQIDF